MLFYKAQSFLFFVISVTASPGPQTHFDVTLYFVKSLKFESS